MSERQEKKMRREIRKQYGATLLKIAEERARLIKKCPKWLPRFVWSMLLSIFVKKQI